MTEPDWPAPAHEPDIERGEDPDTHLLPNLARLQAMTPDQRRELVELVRDWEGPLVERFRARVANLEREAGQ
jgi:hypothetical protein